MDRDTLTTYNRAVALVLLAICLAGPARAANQALSLPDSVQTLCLPAESEALPGGLLHDQQRPWQTLPSKGLQFGFTSDTCWVRWQMPAVSDGQRADAILVVDDPMLADISLYQQQGQQPFVTMTAGTDHPWDTRPLNSLRPAFPLKLSPDSPTTLLLRARSPHSLRIPLSLTGPEQLAATEHRRLLIQAGFIGAMLVMMAWHSILFLSLRERAHLLYLGWLASSSLFALTLNGVTQRFLWPNWPLLSGHVALLLLPLLITFPARFTSDFLHLPERAPDAARRLHYLGQMGLGLLVLSAFIDRYLMVPLMAVGALVTVSVAAWSAWQRVRDGDADAQAFLAGWAVLMLGGLLMGASRFGLLPPSELADGLFQAGLIVQVSLLALIMASHIRGLDSARLQSEAAQREAESLRQHAINEARSRFLATVSHQFRAPMNAVQGMAELLRRNDQLDQQSRQQADTIYQAARALMATLNDLLDYSSIQSGRVQLDLRQVALDEILSDVVDLFAAAICRKKLSLHCFVESRVPACITSDPTRLKQILINLVSNAVKHTDQGEITISLSVRDQHPDGRVTLMIELSDTGEGMDKEALEAVKTRACSEDNAGNGLAVSSELVRLLGGKLDIESTPGQGTQVAFTLLCHPAPAPPAALTGMNLLVIGESRRARLSLGQLVRLWGMDARETTLDDIDQQRRSQWQPDLLLIDQPTYLALKSRSADAELEALPWIVMEATESGGQHAHPAGCCFLPLPLRPLALREALTELLGQSRPAGKSQPARSGLQVGKGLSVMVVDDDQVSQMVISSLLQSLAVSVQVAGSGQEALALFEAHPERWPVIFMDCEMPGMDGFDTTARMREQEQTGQRTASWIVALTAHSDRTTESRARAAGVNDFLAKPVSRQQLSDTLERALRQQPETSAPA